MANQNTNDDDFLGGFLIKDKSGQFKKVQEDNVIDYKPATKSAPAPAKFVPEEKVPAPPAPAFKPRPVPLSASPAGLQPPISTSDKAALHMAPDDETEIKQHADQLKQLVAKPYFDLDVTLSSLIEEVIHKQDLHFENEAMMKRFTKVIESRLKDIRNSMETEEVLTRQKKVGGLELTPDKAKSVIAAVENELSSIRQAGLQPEIEERKAREKAKQESAFIKKEEAKAFTAAPPAFILRPKPVTEPAEKPAVAPQEIEEKPEELAKQIEQQLIAVKKETEKKKLPSEQPFMEEKVPQPALQPSQDRPHELYKQPTDELMTIARARRPESERPQMADIKQPVKVVGPVEELGEIDLQEFRRLGANPQEAAERVLDKINLLEEESWQFKMDGIKSWKKSPANQLYIDIGRQSIESEKSVMEVIRQRQQASQPHLLFEEFLAINTLNGQMGL